MFERNTFGVVWERATDVYICCIAFLAFAAMFAFALFTPSPVSAAFTQPFACQVKPGASGTPENFEPAGISVDAAEKLWVSETSQSTLDEFNSSCDFVGPEPGPAPLQLKGSVSVPKGSTFHDSLSIDYLSGNFFISGFQTKNAFGPFVEVFNNAGILQPWNEDEFSFAAHIAVDNSTESMKDPSACGSLPLSPSECLVYVAHGDTDPSAPDGEGLPKGIEKFSTSGAPIDFSGCGTCLSYVKGNEITGTPTAGDFGFRQPGDTTVDSFGNIFTVKGNEIDEYKPSGEFVESFTGQETPGLGENHGNAGFGGTLEGIAVDPVNGLLAVSISEAFLEEPARDQGAVDEFDPSSGRFLNQITETSSGAHLGSAQGMTFDSQGDLYVVDSQGHMVDVYGPGRFLPAFRLVEVNERTSNSVVLNDLINPQDASDPEKPGLAECDFQYVTEETFKKEGFSKPSIVPCTPAAGEIPDESLTAVHAKINGLASGTTYYYRLVATIAGKLGGTSATEALAFTISHAPRVDGLSTVNGSSTFIDLHAQINPLGADTHYYFQYVDEANFDSTGYANAQKSPVSDIGSGGPTGGADVGVVQQVGGLIPDTVYHFRVIAENAFGMAPEREDSFATLPPSAPGLPDERAYELVTPSDKAGATDMFAFPESGLHEFRNRDVGYPSDSGDSFLLETNSAFGPFAASVANRYVFRRDPAKGEWTYISLASPSLGVQRISGLVFNPFDFAQVGFADIVGSDASETDVKLVGAVGPPGGPYSTTFNGPLEQSGTKAGASHDLSHVVIESLDHALAPGAAGQDPESNSLYDWNGSGECNEGTSNCSLVNITPEGSVFKCGALLGQRDNPGTKYNAVSYNGSKIFFTAPDPYTTPPRGPGGPGCWNGKMVNTPQLYMRSGGETVEISAPEAGVSDPSGQHPAIYVGASQENAKGGVRVFFITETELTRDAQELGLHDAELYEYDTESGKLTRISADKFGRAAAAVFTVPAVSADGSAVYFTAFGALAPGALSLKEPLGSGEGPINLYRYDTGSGVTTYVATVNVNDYPTDKVDEWWTGTSLPADIALTTAANWYTTPDGDYLLFATTRELKHGYSTVPLKGICALPHNGGSTSNGHCDELYRYHYEPESELGGSLLCVSCNPSGAPPVSDAEFTRSAPQAFAGGPVRAMSNDGADIFFDTADGLVPQDDNQTLDVYEWDEGRVSLLSSGQDSAPSFFLGADPEGHNVFFGTHAQLVPQDTDTNGDIYDARICTTADPCIKPPQGQTAQCEGDACQNPSPAPIDATPVSLTFSGAGNISSSPGSVVKPKSLTRAQQLARALKSCRRMTKRKQAACETQARKHYGAKSKAKKAVRERHPKTSMRRGG